MSKLDIRSELHRLNGLLLDNRLLDAYYLLQRMSIQMDDEFYSQWNEKGNESMTKTPTKDSFMYDETDIGLRAPAYKVWFLDDGKTLAYEAIWNTESAVDETYINESGG